MFPVGKVDGGDHIASMDVLSAPELWVTPVFVVPPQAIVFRPVFVTVQVPIICSLSVFAINNTPRNTLLPARPLTVTTSEDLFDANTILSLNTYHESNHSYHILLHWIE